MGVQEFDGPVGARRGPVKAGGAVDAECEVGVLAGTGAGEVR